MNDLFYIQWHITNSCNLRCKHCYQDDFSGSRDLEWTELQKVSGNVVSTLRRWGRSACIHLTGGEPLLKPELFPLMAALDQDPMIGELGIITNGVLFDREITSRLADVSKLRKIKVSLDGATPEVNDAIRPRGTYDRVIECIRRLEEGNRFEITVMFTVMKSNFRDLAALIRLCQDLKVQGLILERFIPWGRGREIRGEVLGKEEWNELLETLADLLGVGAGRKQPARRQHLSLESQKSVFRIGVCEREGPFEVRDHDRVGSVGQGPPESLFHLLRHLEQFDQRAVNSFVGVGFKRGTPKIILPEAVIGSKAQKSAFPTFQILEFSHATRGFLKRFDEHIFQLIVQYFFYEAFVFRTGFE